MWWEEFCLTSVWKVWWQLRSLSCHHVSLIREQPRTVRVRQHNILIGYQLIQGVSESLWGPLSRSCVVSEWHLKFWMCVSIFIHLVVNICFKWSDHKRSRWGWRSDPKKHIQDGLDHRCPHSFGSQNTFAFVIFIHFTLRVTNISFFFVQP